VKTSEMDFDSGTYEPPPLKEDEEGDEEELAKKPFYKRYFTKLVRILA
jgi:hypothetical protein